MVRRTLHAAITELQASSAAALQRLQDLPLDADEADGKAACEGLSQSQAPALQQVSLQRCYRCMPYGGSSLASAASWAAAACS